MLGAIMFGLILFSHTAGAASRVGQVSRIQAFAQAVTEGDTHRLSRGTAIYLNDEIITGDNARLELTFADGTRITVGEKARLVIDSFVYQPEADRSRVNLVITGAFRFVTGKAGRLAPKNIQVRTPLAVIGVRGTDFFGGPLDKQYGVLLFEGSVAVTNAQGEAILDRPGQGTNIASPGQPPGAVTIWPRDKVDRALAAIAFR